MSRTYRLGTVRRLANRAMTWLVRAGVGPRSTYLLTTTGRRTGIPRTTPVIVVEVDDRRWLVSPYGDVGWVHNLRGGSAVTLRRGRSTQTLEPTEVAADEAGPVLRRYLTLAPITGPFFDAREDDPVEVFVAEAARHPVFRLT